MRKLALFILTLSFLSPSPLLFAQDLKGELEHEGIKRSYSLHIPELNAAELAPLVIALHGRFGDGERLAYFSEFDRVADEHDFLVVYPDGIDGEWNYTKDIPGYPTDRADDSSFLVALTHQLSQDYPIDKTKIYVVGLSNGGFMAQRLACEAPELFAAFASVAAAGFGGMPRLCQNPTPLSILLMHGTHDTNIPWNGMSQSTPNGQQVLILASVLDTVTFWVSYAGCSEAINQKSIEQKGNSPETKVTVFSFNDCPKNNSISLYAISGGGHNWPGVKGKIPEAIAGQVNRDIHASEEIWYFFSQHQKPKE